MKTKVLFFLALGACNTFGCESKEDGRDTYLIVGGPYCAKTTVLVNTCTGEGPYELEHPLLEYFIQESDFPEGSSEGIPNGEVQISTIGFYFGGFLKKDGHFSTRFENYEVADPNIDRVLYHGLFTGTSGNAVYATHHETVGPDDPDDCDMNGPCHFRIEFHHSPWNENGPCYLVVKFSGRKMEEGEYYCTDSGE